MSACGSICAYGRGACAHTVARAIPVATVAFIRYLSVDKLFEIDAVSKYLPLCLKQIANHDCMTGRYWQNAAVEQQATGII
jgi:hypothetical protein